MPRLSNINLGLKIFLLTAAVAFGDRKVHDQQFLSTQEGVMASLNERYGSKVEKLFFLYDKVNSNQILVCIDKENKKCFVSFGGRDLFIRVKLDNKIQEPGEIFSPEIARARFKNKNLRSIDADGLLTEEFNMEIGHWFSKPSNQTIKILFSSSDGDFLIKWRKEEDEPVVTIL